MKQEIIDALIGIAGKDQVFYQPEDIESYIFDSTEEQVRPEPCRDVIVVRPGTYDEVSAVMKLANETHTKVIVRGGGTGATGAAVPTYPCIIMAMERFKSIVELDPIGMMVTCQAGVSLAQLNEYLADNCRELYFPCHPGDEGAHVGGMMIENAGGVRAVKHGIMRGYVKGAKVCLPSGSIIQLGGKIVKNNMGYDLLHTLIGSEGTLAIVLEVTIKLFPRLECYGTMVCAFPDTPTAVRAVSEVQKTGLIPLAVELMDRPIALTTADAIGKTWPMRDEGKVDIIYMLEEATEDALYEAAEKISTICEENGAVNSVIAQTDKEQRDILEVRSLMYEVHLPYFVDSLDTAVPMSHVAELLSDFDAIAAKYNTTTPRVGHIVDGNFHNFIMREEKDGPVPAWADDIRRDFYAAALKYGGTVTAEHGTGRTRKQYLEMQFSPEVIEIMRGMKKAFDPNGILNPGCIFDLD